MEKGWMKRRRSWEGEDRRIGEQSQASWDEGVYLKNIHLLHLIPSKLTNKKTEKKQRILEQMIIFNLENKFLSNPVISGEF
jgi:hypothetical protein